MSICSRRRRSRLAAGLFVLVAGFSAARAGENLTVRVPWDFHAGSQRFEPGAYVVALDRAPDGRVTIRSETTGRSVTVDVRKADEGGTWPTSAVAFRAYGDLRFLSAIQVQGGAGWVVAVSADEAALARTRDKPKVMSLKARMLLPD